MKLLPRPLVALALTSLSAPGLAQWVTPPVSAPGVEYRTFTSAAAGAVVSYHVWLPPPYSAQPSARFPVLYWLHGSGSATAPISPLSNWFATAVADGRMPPVLVVFPNGMPYGMWCNSRDGTTPMEDVVLDELIPEVDASYRTVATRAGRLVEGFSMGGQGAARFAFRRPDLFAGASILGAGPLQLDFLDEPPCSSMPLTLRLQIYADVWGSDPTYYLAQTPRTLAQQNAAAIQSSGIVLRQAVGAADCMLANNVLMHGELQQLGIAHEWSAPANVGHDALALFNALGLLNWEFYRDALFPAGSGSPYCFGDGSGAACPCGNSGGVGRGCASTLGIGARLRAHGVASVSNDSFTLSVYPVPGASVLFFQGLSQSGGGPGTVFGDGLRCASGSVIRLGAKTPTANYAVWGPPSDTPISVKCQIPLAGGTRTYQAWYRNPDPSFCSADTFNLSNGWTVDWLP